MVLPALECKLRLQKQIVSRDEPPTDSGRNRLADGRLIVVASLVGRVNRAKALF
jgi:hypothetical protein